MFAVCQVAINLTRNRLTHPQSSFMTRDMEARDGKQGVRAPSRSPSRASFKKNWASQRNRIGSCLDFRLGCIVGDSINSMPCIWHNSISSLALKSWSRLEWHEIKQFKYLLGDWNQACVYFYFGLLAVSFNNFVYLWLCPLRFICG